MTLMAQSNYALAGNNAAIVQKSSHYFFNEDKALLKYNHNIYISGIGCLIQ